MAIKKTIKNADQNGKDKRGERGPYSLLIGM
jgi:hypothetical protein